mmetsp:Transcript_56624/g.120235  ORF Transcript_56624/g.120235 Transcript_56624/m.120235 type:complete len:262 (-) Transcript_56624:978-1763(-)
MVYRRWRALCRDDRVPVPGVRRLLDDPLQQGELLLRLGRPGRLPRDDPAHQVPPRHDVGEAELVQVRVPPDVLPVPLAPQLVSLLQLEVVHDPPRSDEVLDFEPVPQGGVGGPQVGRVDERPGALVVLPLCAHLPGEVLLRVEPDRLHQRQGYFLQRHLVAVRFGDAPRWRDDQHRPALRLLRQFVLGLPALGVGPRDGPRLEHPAGRLRRQELGVVGVGRVAEALVDEHDLPHGGVEEPRRRELRQEHLLGHHGPGGPVH